MAGESAEQVARRHRDKIARLERSAHQWERGAAGERATAEALKGLPSDRWTVLHDVRWPGRRYANIDHVAIGTDRHRCAARRPSSRRSPRGHR